MGSIIILIEVNYQIDTDIWHGNKLFFGGSGGDLYKKIYK